MKFGNINITGLRRVVFKSYRFKDKDIKEKTIIWNRIAPEQYDGDEDLDDYFKEFIWVKERVKEEDEDVVRDDTDMVNILCRLHSNSRFYIWTHNESINIKDLKRYYAYIKMHPEVRNRKRNH